VRVAAIADLHFGRTAVSAIQELFARLSGYDVVAICGDLTDHGLVEEAQGLAREMKAGLRPPVVAVLGNHDYDAGAADGVTAVLRENGVQVLDGDACEIAGVGFAGAKGFCGGFGPHTLSAWGEAAIKQFVQEAIGEAMKLETALARVRGVEHVALLHYAPVAGTVEGEPPMIYPFLGSSRLEEPLLRASPAAVCHGHAHHGRPEAQTTTGTTVYNVSWPLRQRVRPDQPFQVLELVPGPRRLTVS
jgi:Icc-related predicted phosphoesterase